MAPSEMTPRDASAARNTDVRLDVDGQFVPTRQGETLASALMAAGITDFRDTQRGASRGLFCGMGVCHDCLVTVDGEANCRACMTKVTGPHVLRRQSFPGHLQDRVAGAVPITVSDLPVRRPDVLVIGGGAGGLSAAAMAAEAGARVVLIDERAQPGGQYYKQPSETRRPTADIGAEAQFGGGRTLIARACQAGVEILSQAEAWGAFAPMTIGVTSASGSVLFRPRRLIVATGAYERGLPVPGWTLPGVMTTGAAQTLLKTDGVVPGRRIVVCGNGPLNLQVALELARAGAEIVAVAELADQPDRAAAPALWRMLRTSSDLAWQGLRMVRELRRRRIPLLYGHGLMRVDTDGASLMATLGQRAGNGLNPGPRFAVDAVLMGYGFMPSNEVLRALGCRHDFDRARGQLVTRRDDRCETSVPGVYGVGDCCGLGGARAAGEEGLIAGAAAARALGHTLSAGAMRTLEVARARLVRHRRFQAALWQLFSAPRLHAELAQADTIICRCEEVTLGVIDAALADGFPAIGEIKRRTRLGMGRCQGRYCSPLLAAILAERQARPLDERGFFAPRAPVKPVAIRDLVRAAAAGDKSATAP